MTDTPASFANWAELYVFIIGAVEHMFYFVKSLDISPSFKANL